MSGFPILDLVVGMIFIYFMLSIITSSAIELILTGMKVRASVLREWLFKIFDKPITQPDGTKIRLGQAIMDHCSVTALSEVGSSTSYIDAKNFTSALLEKISYETNPKKINATIDEFIESIEKTSVLSTEFQRVLLTYANEAKDTYKSVTEKTASEIELFRSKIETWYDSSMERVGGYFKKKYIRPFTILVAIAVAIALNADSIAISKYLYSNPEVRTKIAMQAYNAAEDSALLKRVEQLRIAPSDTATDTLSLEEIKKIVSQKITDIDKVKNGLNDVIPLTWKKGEFSGESGKFSILLFFSKLTGLVATVLAIIMGAPFWFDMLNKDWTQKHCSGFPDF